MIKLIKIILGIVIFIVLAVIAFGIVIYVLNRNNKPKKEVQTFNATAEGYTVNIDVKDSFVTVKKSKTNNVTVTYYQSETRTFDVENTTDTLSVKGYQTGKWYNRIFISLKLTKVYETVVEVPDDINVNIKTDNGNINVNQVDLTTFKAETTNGGVMLDNVNAAIINIESTNGNIEVKNTDTSLSFKGKTKKGRILLDHLKSLVTIDAETGSGNITIDNTYAIGNINLHTGKGNITGPKKTTGVIRLISDSYYKVNAKAKNGTCSLENTTTGIAELNVSTDNGNIDLELKSLI